MTRQSEFFVAAAGGTSRDKWMLCTRQGLRLSFSRLSIEENGRQDAPPYLMIVPSGEIPLSAVDAKEIMETWFAFTRPSEGTNTNTNDVCMNPTKP